MSRQTRTTNPTAARALSQLGRMTSVGRKSGRIARAAASIALAKQYRWQVPAEALGLKNESLLLKREAAGDGSGGGFGVGSGWREAESRSVPASSGSRRHRATALVEAATRSHRQIPELSQAMKALLRMSQLAEYATAMSGSNTHPTRALEGLKPKVASFADKGVLAKVRTTRSTRGVTPPSNVSRRKFAQAPGNRGVSSDGGGRGGITINSSPTVVINGSGGGAVQNNVIGALRAHREELFDQLRRESAQRERAQF